jgi:hypothetical protein
MMTQLLIFLNNLVSAGWDGLSPIITAVWSKGVFAALGAVLVVVLVYQEVRR